MHARPSCGLERSPRSEHEGEGIGQCYPTGEGPLLFLIKKMNIDLFLENDFNLDVGSIKAPCPIDTGRRRPLDKKGLPWS